MVMLVAKDATAQLDIVTLVSKTLALLLPAYGITITLLRLVQSLVLLIAPPLLKISARLAGVYPLIPNSPVSPPIPPLSPLLRAATTAMVRSTIPGTATGGLLPRAVPRVVTT